MSDNRYGKPAPGTPRTTLSRIGPVIGFVGIGGLIYGSATGSPLLWGGGALMFVGGFLYMLPRLGSNPVGDNENASTQQSEPHTRSVQERNRP